MKDECEKERAVIVGLGLKSEPLSEIKESLAELEELVYAAGAKVVGVLTQTLDKLNPATLMGKGKTQEVVELVAGCRASIVIVDHPLSGIQSRKPRKKSGGSHS